MSDRPSISPEPWPRRDNNMQPELPKARKEPWQYRRGMLLRNVVLASRDVVISRVSRRVGDEKLWHAKGRTFHMDGWNRRLRTRNAIKGQPSRFDGSRPRQHVG